MTVLIPDQMAAIPEMEVDQGAKAVTDQLRATATKTADVGSWTAANAAPEGWAGDASEAAHHAMTTFSATIDAVTAAFTTVAAACDEYVTQLTVLAGERLDMFEDRTAVNNDIQALVAAVHAADVEEEPKLQMQADALQARVTRLDERLVAWQARVASNEDALIAAFRSADTVGEGRALSKASDRPDVDALNRELDGVKGDPKAVNAWWMALTPAEREALKIDNPDAVGNTDGIPVDDRDEANRASMTRDLDRLHALEKERELTPEEQQLLKNAEAARDALDKGDTVTDPSTGLPVDSNLMLYLPGAIHGDGAAAVAYGNPDTADNTSVVVPGIMNTMGSVGANGESALDLFAQANRADPDASNATIAWIGYDSPDFDTSQLKDPVNALDMAMVSNEKFAEAGGKHLSSFVDGLRASDTGEQSHLTVIGHSYGSTTAAHAAHDGLAADDLVLLGSPGAGGDAHDVSDLNMPDGHVFVGSRDKDFVTWLGGESRLGLGEDPSQASFGADRIDVGDGESFHAEDIGGQGLENHTSYFDPGSKSLDNIADITVGNDPDSIDGRDQPARDYLVDYVKDEGAYYGNEVYEDVRDQVAETTGDVLETGGKVLDGAGHVLENTGRLLSPPMPTFGGMFH
jgi:pimeloyl-ACP methyl ester carboxylesterase